jgi:hypothetical protein
MIGLDSATGTITFPAPGTNPQDGDLQNLEYHTGDVCRTNHVPLPHRELKDRQARGGRQQGDDANVNLFAVFGG